MFDDLDPISRSQVCQNHKLQIFLDTFPTGVVFFNQWYLVATCLKKIKHSMPYVTGVYLREKVT